MFYFLLGCLSAKERSKQTNTFVLTLGPHGSNSPDVVESIRPSFLSPGAGIKIKWKGTENKTLVAFPLSVLGDIPQQQISIMFTTASDKHNFKNTRCVY